MRLGFVLDTVDGSEVVTGRVSNPVIKNSSPGGFASVEFDLVRRLDESRLPANSRVRVYDTSSGEQVGGGRVVEQGLNDDGTWKIACLGEGLAALQDIDEPYMVIDSELKPFTQPSSVGVKTKTIGRKQRKYKKNAGSVEAVLPRYQVITSDVRAEAKTGTAPNGSEVEGLLFQVPEGTTVPTGSYIAADLDGPYRCGMRLASYRFRFMAGSTTGDWRLRSGSVPRDDAWNTGLSGWIWQVSGTNFASTLDRLRIWIVRAGATYTAGPGAWLHVRDLIVRSQLYGPNGSLMPGSSHTSGSVGVGTVFTDLVWRRCPSLKVGSVASTSHAFSQLAWYDGTTAKEVLDELCEADGTVTYHAWEADDDGRTPINLDLIKTPVRYELSTKHGFSAPSPTGDVYDTVVVTAPASGGGPMQRVRVTRNTDGYPRSQTVRLDTWPPGGLTAEANKFLDMAGKTPNAGTATVAERVLDLWTGRWVHPAGIRSGHLCRVRGVQPTPDTLNPDADQDGVTVFRVATNTYSDGIATLELDQPVLNQDRAFAALLG